MSVDWTTYRLLLCNSPELEQEGKVFNAANVKFAENVTMPDRVLFALASPRPDFDPRLHGRALESNIRFCDFFAQLLGESITEPAYSAFIDLAIACTAAPAFPMRSTVVLFRNPENASPEMASLRRRLMENPGCDVRDFHSLDELDAVAGEILANWYALVRNKTGAPAAPASRAPGSTSFSL